MIRIFMMNSKYPYYNKEKLTLICRVVMSLNRKRKFVSADELHNGMKVGKAVVDGRGRTLLEDGVVLDDFMIDALPKMGVFGVYIKEDAEVPEETFISAKAAEMIKKLEVPDRTKVKLTESVKERVAEGIQFLFNNTESAEFEEAADSITNELMKAILEDDAIAVDISILKVSDEYTFKHSVDVATMAMIIAKAYGLSEKEIYEIGIAGLLHDIGKAKIPNEVLNKPDKLTNKEFELMKMHSTYGYQILKEKGNISNSVLLGVLQHHEKINGKGYPSGVASDKISLYARIISIADIYDALVTERPYKKAFSQRDAVEMIMSMTGELDIGAMKSFLESIILYPVGMTVQLSNGEKAKVVENDSHYALRPKVVGVETGEVYDLAEDLHCANIVIV